jgi:hypothetical protein
MRPGGTRRLKLLTTFAGPTNSPHLGVSMHARTLTWDSKHHPVPLVLPRLLAGRAETETRYRSKAGAPGCGGGLNRPNPTRY